MKNLSAVKMVIDKESVTEALKHVIDPELGMSIVDLGMMKNVEVKGDTVNVKIALTVPNCPLVRTIRNDIQVALKDASSVNVEFTSMNEEDLERLREKLNANNRIG